MNSKDTPIGRVTALVERAITDEVGRHAKEKFWVTHYGANDIHPKHLVYWIVVGSDYEKHRLEANSPLMAVLRSLLMKYDSPSREGTGFILASSRRRQWTGCLTAISITIGSSGLVPRKFDSVWRNIALARIDPCNHHSRISPAYFDRATAAAATSIQLPCFFTQVSTKRQRFDEDFPSFT